MYILIRFCLKTFLKNNIFFYKDNDYSYTFAMEYLAPGEMFENMLQLMRFSVYFEGVLNTNNGYFRIKTIISAAHMLEGLWARSLRENLGKSAIWCVLMFHCILY